MPNTREVKRFTQKERRDTLQTIKNLRKREGMDVSVELEQAVLAFLEMYHPTLVNHAEKFLQKITWYEDILEDLIHEGWIATYDFLLSHPVILKGKNVTEIHLNLQSMLERTFQKVLTQSVGIAGVGLNQLVRADQMTSLGREKFGNHSLSTELFVLLWQLKREFNIELSPRQEKELLQKVNKAKSALYQRRQCFYFLLSFVSEEQSSQLRKAVNDSFKSGKKFDTLIELVNKQEIPSEDDEEFTPFPLEESTNFLYAESIAHLFFEIALAKYSDATPQAFLDFALSPEMTLREAARLHKIPSATLEKRFKSIAIVLRRKRTILWNEMERIEKH